MTRTKSSSTSTTTDEMESHTVTTATTTEIKPSSVSLSKDETFTASTRGEPTTQKFDVTTDIRLVTRSFASSSDSDYTPSTESKTDEPSSDKTEVNSTEKEIRSLEKRLTTAQSVAIGMGILLLLFIVIIFCYIAFAKFRRNNWNIEQIERPIISSPIVRTLELFEMTAVSNENYYEREGMPSIDER